MSDLHKNAKDVHEKHAIPARGYGPSPWWTILKTLKYSFALKNTPPLLGLRVHLSAKRYAVCLISDWRGSCHISLSQMHAEPRNSFTYKPLTTPQQFLTSLDIHQTGSSPNGQHKILLWSPSSIVIKTSIQEQRHHIQQKFDAWILISKSPANLISWADLPINTAE